ncbi:MAG: sensor histidine kinase [Eudoraea sp.]|nr:sensor histidine kinase [Eudoraea sp.]
MKTISISPVKQSQLVIISLLVSLLMSLPKTLFIYDMIDKGKMDISVAVVLDLVLQGFYFFVFSWAILQLCANWGYQFIERAAVRIITVILISIAFLYGSLYLLDLVYPSITGQSLSPEGKGFIYFKTAIVFIVLFFVARVLRLQLIQKESVLENEELKQQNLQTELVALKNQIDPHFLFNSLNSLNSLIRDNKEATAFVSKLSFMYRYILQSSDKDMLTVREELKFLESYIHMIKTRYRDRFSIDLDINAEDLDKQLPPLALQLLVENAVKHNEISTTHPLEVKIYSKDGAICVENRVRPRTSLAEGTGNGLYNLDKRYYLLGKQKMAITTDNNTFCVKLPLLKTA